MDPVSFNRVEQLVRKFLNQAFAHVPAQSRPSLWIRFDLGCSGRNRALESQSELRRLSQINLDRVLKFSGSVGVEDRPHNPRSRLAFAKTSSAGTPFTFPLRNSCARRSAISAHTFSSAVNGASNDSAI